MSTPQRSPILALIAFAATGVVAGLLLQFVRSARGSAPLVPPISLALSLLVMAGVLLVLGITLRRAVTRKAQRPVNPFHAVRLLAGARAGQFVGALLGGFGGGLALQLLTRSIAPPAASWVPTVLVLGAGAVLLVCALVTESLCRVPPNGPEHTDEGGAPEAEPDAA